jgi:hypothetical protein
VKPIVVQKSGVQNSGTIKQAIKDNEGKKGEPQMGTMNDE